MNGADPKPLVVIVGPTASGKSSLALAIAARCGGEIVSCDSVAVYRGLDIGSAKPSVEDRARILHHNLDVLDPDQPSTAGDYARLARAAVTNISGRGELPVVAGGTGLYLRALLDGLAPAPGRDPALRKRLQERAERRGSASLHNLLQRLDPASAKNIHPNDLPKLIRSLEVRLLASEPQSQQWQVGRHALDGYRVLQIGLVPDRVALYDRIDRRAEAMFHHGLIEETEAVRARFGSCAIALRTLGYAQALAVIEGRQSLPEAIAEAQQGHRNYAKRQRTWFRRDPRIHWLHGFGDDTEVRDRALAMVERHLNEGGDGGTG